MFGFDLGKFVFYVLICCKSVELFLNGKSQGTRSFTAESDMHLAWDVPYEPGELKAVAMKGGKVIRTTVTRTAGPPARIELHRPTLEDVFVQIVTASGAPAATGDLRAALHDEAGGLPP